MALATMVGQKGSTPRKSGARMLVARDGRLLAGTVGGGCGEGEVLEACRASLEDGRPRLVQVDLTRDLVSLSPAVCGGFMEVLVERIDPPTDPQVRIHYRRVPRRETVYRQALVLDGTDVKVTLAGPVDIHLEIGGHTVLEPGADAVWFTVPGAWWDLGRFHRADGTFTGLYANVITPCVFGAGGDWWTTDLLLDVWWPADGGPPTLLDEDELDAARRAGHLTDDLHRRVRAVARDLMEGPHPEERFPWVAPWTRTAARSALLHGGAGPAP
ncbi:MAG: DUF402 domain-containing protein [Gemmatimonadales bacterium]|nr:MAG: DUF402 domain-containing protein [Gemmatimonadales bacterium]